MISFCTPADAVKEEESAMKRLKRVISIGATAVVLASLGAQAQQPTAQTGFKRTPVQQGDLSLPGREGVQAIAEIVPGAESGRHTHPGEEFGYVLEGVLTLEIEGKPAAMKKAGEGFIIPAGTIHNAKNTGKSPTKVLATYIVEKGKPVATPAK
jgi:quercetin dioxygenase-like cupin family protein